jgi:hypothetical protein
MTNPPDPTHTECKVISESEHGVVAFVADKGLIPGQPKWANYVKVSTSGGPTAQIAR